MKDLRYIVLIDNEGFRLNYRSRTGLFYVSTLRRFEESLKAFPQYIKPEHAIWEEWSAGQGANWLRKPFLIDEKTVGYFSRQGQYSFLIYKTFMGNLIDGLNEMQKQAITVTQVARLGNKGQV